MISAVKLRRGIHSIHLTYLLTRSHEIVTSCRCLSIMNPVKGESKSSESWQTFLFRLRQALMAAFSRTLTKFEDTVRTQRERRNELNWNFCNYFLLQVG